MIIKIKNLRLKTIIGVYEWEKKELRNLVFNVEIETDFVKSMQSDNLHDAIDYDLIINQIKDLVNNNHYRLIEKMVGEIIDVIMQDKRIKHCSVEVDKLGVYEDLDSFSVFAAKSNI